MAGLKDLAFNDWAFSNASFTLESLSVDIEEPVAALKSAFGDSQAAPEGTGAGALITVQGKVASSTHANLITFLSDIRKNTRGTDRVKKGRLEIDDSDKHFWCQRAGGVSTQFNVNLGWADVGLTFISDEPFWRANTRITLLKSTSSADPTFNITHGPSNDFEGSAYRMPIAISITGETWAVDDLIIIENTTANWKFEHKFQAAVGSGDTVHIDGESYEVRYDADVIQEGTSGTFPYVVGQSTNAFTVDGSTNETAAWDIAFWDRFIF